MDKGSSHFPEPVEWYVPDRIHDVLLKYPEDEIGSPEKPLFPGRVKGFLGCVCVAHFFGIRWVSEDWNRERKLGKKLQKTHPNTLTQTLPFGSYSTSPPPTCCKLIYSYTYTLQLGFSRVSLLGLYLSYNWVFPPLAVACLSLLVVVSFWHLSNEKRAPGCWGYRGLYYPVMCGLLKKHEIRIPIQQPV